MSSSRKRVLVVVGARPQFVKAAVVSRYLRTCADPAPFEEVHVHTGQHYDKAMSEAFFHDLAMPAVNTNLQVGSGPAGWQLGEMLKRLEPVVKRESPGAMLVFGDTNSTLGAALIAAQSNIPLVHVEAGERVFRRLDVPEESNRVVTDNVASLCLTSTRQARENLLREGFARQRVQFVGDLMYDLFLAERDGVLQRPEPLHRRLGLTDRQYHLATIHRVQNTRNPEAFIGLLDCLDRCPQVVVLPLHPRARGLLEKVHWRPRGNLRLLDPLGYHDFLDVLLHCQRVVTDSGGVTREAFFARRPCIIPMENSWWSEISAAGWSVEVGDDLAALGDALRTFTPRQEAPGDLFGDGASAQRTVHAVAELLGRSKSRESAWHPQGCYHALPKPEVSTFTYANYRRLLGDLTERGYAFRSFEPKPGDGHSGAPVTLLRHDIDLDLTKACEMAHLEAELAVPATYFVMVRTAHYNVLSARGCAAIRQILDCGHELGLHFDCQAYPSHLTSAQLAEACNQEADLLEQWFGRAIEVVSYHRPGPLVMSGDPTLSSPRLHTYMSRFQTAGQYFSDSGGRWAFGLPTDSEAFREGKPLQILVHPIWWHEYPVAPYETLLRFVDRSRRALEISLAQNTRVFRVGQFADVTDP